MALSLGDCIARLLIAHNEDPRIVSCTLSPAATEEIVAKFACAVGPEIVAGRRERILTPSELQQLTFG